MANPRRKVALVVSSARKSLTMATFGHAAEETALCCTCMDMTFAKIAFDTMRAVVLVKLDVRFGPPWSLDYRARGCAHSFAEQ